MATRKTPFRGGGLTRARLIFAALLVLIVAAGIILSGALLRAMWRDFESDGRNEAALLYGQLMTAINEVDHSALNMSESPLVKGALTSDRAPERDRANAVLDRYQKTMDVSICYLMDTRGVTVASSNRMAADSFVGKSFAFRPYFSEAIAGGPGSYLARGSVSNKRGYYASAPVRDDAGRIIGVAVVKDELDGLEEEFRRLPHSFLVSPDGIVFLTSEPNLTFRILWPAAPGNREKLTASKQFGTLDFAPVLQGEPADASHLKYDGDTHYVFQLPLPLAGWSIVHLKNASILARYRLFGALATVFVCALALLGYLALSQSEQRRRLAEERLQEEALWARTFDAVGDLIAIIGPDHRIWRVNKAMALRLGMEPADVVGRHCYELVHGTDGPIGICPHQAALKTGVQATIEAAVPLLAGEFAVTASPLLSPDGAVEGSVHVMHDITESKKAEAALRKSEEQFRTIFDNSLVGIFQTSPEGRFIKLNAALARMTGYDSPEEVMAEITNIGEQLYARSEDRDTIARLLAERGNVDGCEARWIRKDGRTIWVLINPSVVKDADGNVLYYQGACIDISDRKQAEELLAERAMVQSLNAEVGSIWMKAEELPAALQACAEAVVAHLDAAFARIWLLNPEEDVLELKASAGLYTRLDGARSRVPVNESKIGVIAAKRRPHLTNAVVGDPGVVDQEWARREGMVAFAGYPLLAGERLWGVMAMFARHRLSDFTLDELGLVAEKIATGISRMGLEKQVRRSEAHLQNVTAASPTVIYTLTPGFVPTWVSGNIVTMLGYSVQECLNSTWWAEYLHPDDKERVFARAQEVFVRGQVAQEYRFRRRDGGYVWIRDELRQVRDAAGQPSEIVGAWIDITAKKQTEEEIARSERRLRVAQHQGKMGDWEIDLATKALSCSDEVYAIVGLQPERTGENRQDDVTGKEIHPDAGQRVMAFLHQAFLAADDGWPMEYGITLDSGEERVLFVSASVERDAQGKPVRRRGVVQDITERKRAEETLKRYAEAQEVLLREVNHRVKNNLAVIISLLHKEEDRAKQNGLTGSLPALSDLHDRIEGLLIVHGMLSSAKWQDLKISELCSTLVTRIARSLARKLTVKIGETAVTVNSGQAHYLALVLNELVTNSLKYAAPFSERPEIAIAISRDHDKIGIEYRDNGPGYPEAVVNGDYSGTSIGFDLMNGIVRQSLRGRIAYRNEDGAVAEIVFPG